MDSAAPVGFYTMHSIGLFCISVLLVAVVLELVRRGYLKERYALLWLFVSAGGLIVGLFPNSIVLLSKWLGFQYLTTVSMFAFLYLLALVLIFTVIISRLSEKNRSLAQEVALLAQRLDTLETAQKEACPDE